MKLREIYVESELQILERETKEAIDRIMMNPGVKSPEYEPKYLAIMDNYRLRWQVLQSLKPSLYD
jgi:hypothetical protein